MTAQSRENNDFRPVNSDTMVTAQTAPALDGTDLMGEGPTTGSREPLWWGLVVGLSTVALLLLVRVVRLLGKPIERVVLDRPLPQRSVMSDAQDVRSESNQALQQDGSAVLLVREQQAPP